MGNSKCARATCSNARLLCSLGCAFLLFACGRGQHSASKDRRDRAADKPEGRIVEASWYKVPDGSLPRRRADRAELTAASDRFPLGTLVHVTQVSNGKSVVVRITDTGLRGSKAAIDLSEEAAEELGMVRKGVAKVRVQALESDADARSASGPER